jgi:hypothetical protein
MMARSSTPACAEDAVSNLARYATFRGLLMQLEEV